MMWSQKHRPTRLSECVLDHIDDEAQNLLREAVTAATLPNLLLYGPPGTGKTTIARILCDPKRFEVHAFNGSLFEKHDMPKLKEIVSTCSLYLKPKCIMIDEVDGVTMSAQRALRALMEDDRRAGDVSWVCTANDLSKIMLPLQSRVILVDCSYATRAKLAAHFAGIALARLNIEIKDRFGNPVVPREWFLVPLSAIDDAVEKIKDGTITGYVYDPQQARLKRGASA
jgi:replication-associated recombination protein RarA